MCSATCWLIFPPHWKKKNSGKAENNAELYKKPCKKGRRLARKFQGFVIKTHKEVFLKRFLLIQRIPHCWNISILVLRMQSEIICPCYGLPLDAGWGWIQVEIPSWAVSREKFCWNLPSSCSDRAQDDKGSNTDVLPGVAELWMSLSQLSPCCGQESFLALLFQSVTQDFK